MTVVGACMACRTGGLSADPLSLDPCHADALRRAEGTDRDVQSANDRDVQSSGPIHEFSNGWPEDRARGNLVEGTSREGAVIGPG